MNRMDRKTPMKRTVCFDALIELDVRAREIPSRLMVNVNGETVPVSIYRVGERKERGRVKTFVNVQLSHPLSLNWKQTFTLKCPETGDVLGHGKVLDPAAEKLLRKQKKRRLEYLLGLYGDEKQMLLAVAKYLGILGVQEKDLIRFGPFPRARLLEMSQELESEALIRILEFTPLFIISQDALSYLCERIIQFLERYHEKYPGDPGVPKKMIQERFGVHPRVLNLALKYLHQRGQVVEEDDRVALNSFEMTLLPEEEDILDRMEEMYLKDKFQSYSLEELKKFFRLSSKRMNKMLAILIERKKIVLGKDGFILHSHWLDEVIQRIRNSGKKELTVADFKEMTGLTRKFAIPLLELLDQMGVTKRRGSSREIL